MATKDIKVGNFYHVLVKVLHIDPINGEIATETANEFGTSLNMEPTYFARCEKEAFFPITPENGIKNSETSPKYDPCRELRAGDKVKLKTNFGRNPYDTFDGSEYIPDDTVFTVLRDEWAGGKVDIYEKDETDAFTVHFTNLELITPVEELDPYNVKFLQAGEIPDTYYYWAVMDNMGNEVARFWHEQYEKGQAEAAAEAECARLNEAYRKEQE